MKRLTLLCTLAGCGPHMPAFDASSSSETSGGETSSSTSTSTGLDQPDVGTPDLPQDEPFDTDRPLLVFITTITYRGDTITTYGQTPDDICQEVGDLVFSGKIWRAWVSMGGDSPAASFTRTSANYVRTDGVVVAQGWGDLTDGSLLAPINIDAYGYLKPEPWWTETHQGAYHGAWTGTLPNGEASVPEPPPWDSPVEWSDNCSDWTTADWSGAFGSGVFGYEDAIDHQWTKADDVPNDGGGTTNCVNDYFFYCFEQ